jgi:hypothetical protein
VRLDHLLSKEHLAPVGVSRRQFRDECSWLVAHGWNIDIGSGPDGSNSVRLFRGQGTVRGTRFGACTLLGPEGPDQPSGCFDSRTLFLSAGEVGGEGDRPYFENYTVDASILDSDSLCEGLSLLDLNFF